MTCSTSASVWTCRTLVLTLLLVGGCGSSPSGLLKNSYHHDNGCSEGVAAAIERAISHQLGECVERSGEDEVSSDIVARAERSLDRAERDYARGYVRCFERAFDLVYPAITADQHYGCPPDREDDCMSDADEGPTFDRSLFEYRATATCPSYARHVPGCSAILYQQSGDPRIAPYLVGISDGTDCLARDSSDVTLAIEDRQARACRRTAYDLGWTVGHVACLNRTDGWRDAPEVAQ